MFLTLRNMLESLQERRVLGQLDYGGVEYYNVNDHEYR